MNEFPLERPEPDFEKFRRVLLGEAKPEKVHLSELLIDPEIVEEVYAKYFGKRLVPFDKVFSKPQIAKRLLHLGLGKGLRPMIGKAEREYVKQIIEFYHGMGYDYVTDMMPGLYVIFMVRPNLRSSSDTADYSRGERTWADEGGGMIDNWEDFEKFHWKRLRVNLDRWAEFWEKELPEGMKVMVNGSHYELIMEWLLGYEGLFLKLHDEPELVEAIFNRVGEMLYEFYEQAITCDAVGGLFHSDDMGYKAGTMIRPDDLRRLIFPWLKKYSKLAHSHDKMFWLHSCGNLKKVYDELIEDVKIDAYHSYQDEIMPVSEFKEKYGDRVASLGGVDVDNLARMEEKPLREYCRKILDECMPKGRYAFGSGNSVTNYIPVKNYLIMLDEAGKWCA